MSELAQKSGKLRKLRQRHSAPDDDSTWEHDAAMPPLTIGCAVRLYYDEETYDEGEVTMIADGRVLVDFYDWIERWETTAQFAFIDLYLEQKQVWVATCGGTLITDFGLPRPANA